MLTRLQLLLLFLSVFSSLSTVQPMGFQVLFGCCTLPVFTTRIALKAFSMEQQLKSQSV